MLRRFHNGVAAMGAWGWRPPAKKFTMLGGFGNKIDLAHADSTYAAVAAQYGMTSEVLNRTMRGTAITRGYARAGYTVGGGLLANDIWGDTKERRRQGKLF